MFNHRNPVVITILKYVLLISQGMMDVYPSLCVLHQWGNLQKDMMQIFNYIWKKAQGGLQCQRQGSGKQC